MNVNINDYLKYNSDSNNISKYFVTYAANNPSIDFNVDNEETETTNNFISTPILNSIKNPIINNKLVKITNNSNNNTQTTIPTTTKTTGTTGTSFKSEEDFIRKLLPIAEKIGKEKGIDPNIILSQAAFESNYGKNTLSKKANNIFSIQVPKNKQGKGRGLAHQDSNANKELYNTEFEIDNSIEDNVRRWANMIFNQNSKNYKNSANAARISASEFNRVHAASPYAEGIGKTSQEKYNFKYNAYQNAYNKILNLRKKFNI